MELNVHMKFNYLMATAFENLENMTCTGIAVQFLDICILFASQKYNERLR
jgi:hypothetical protein